MLYSIITIAALAGTLAMLIDLKINHWEWTDQQREIFATIGALISVWAVKRSPSVWLRFLVAALLCAAIIMVYRAWRKHKRQGGHFTLPQLATGLAILIVSGWVFFGIVQQLILLGVVRGGI